MANRDGKPSTGESGETPGGPPEVGYDDTGPVLGPEDRSGDTAPSDESSVVGSLVAVALAAFQALGHVVLVAYQSAIPWLFGTTSRTSGISGHFFPLDPDQISESENVHHAANPSRWEMPLPYVLAWALYVCAVSTFGLFLLGYGPAIMRAITPPFLESRVPPNWWVAPIGIAAFATLILVNQAFCRGSTWHIITDERLVYRKNVIRTRELEIDLLQITSVETHTPIPYRWVGIGSIDVYTASTGGRELRMRGVRQPQEVANAIRLLINQKANRAQEGRQGRGVDRQRTQQGGGFQQQQSHSRPDDTM